MPWWKWLGLRVNDGALSTRAIHSGTHDRYKQYGPCKQASKRTNGRRGGLSHHDHIKTFEYLAFRRFGPNGTWCEYFYSMCVHLSNEIPMILSSYSLTTLGKKLRCRENHFGYKTQSQVRWRNFFIWHFTFFCHDLFKYFHLWRLQCIDSMQFYINFAFLVHQVTSRGLGSLRMCGKW